MPPMLALSAPVRREPLREFPRVRASSPRVRGPSLSASFRVQQALPRLLLPPCARLQLCSLPQSSDPHSTPPPSRPPPSASDPPRGCRASPERWSNIGGIPPHRVQAQGWRACLASLV